MPDDDKTFPNIRAKIHLFVVYTQQEQELTQENSLKRFTIEL